MGARWNLWPGTARLTVVLLVACLTVVLLAAGAQARPTQLAAVGPDTAAYVDISGDCFVSNRWGKVYATMGAYISGTTGTAYLNIYRRFASGNVLISHATDSTGGHSRFISSSARKFSGARYFATWGINSSSGNASGGASCPVRS